LLRRASPGSALTYKAGRLPRDHYVERVGVGAADIPHRGRPCHAVRTKVARPLQQPARLLRHLAVVRHYIARSLTFE
jgi:hypothetical protein